MGPLATRLTQEPTRLRKAVMFGAIVALTGFAVVALPSVANSYELFLATLILIMSVSGLGLTIVMGWSGQIALAHTGFFAIGAYGSAVLHGHGWNWLLAVLAACGVSVATGVLLGFPAARLKGFYLAIATLAFAVLIQRVSIAADSITGGVTGLPVPSITFGYLDAASTLWYASLVTFVVTLAFGWRLRTIGIGRAIYAVRDVEVATGGLGIHATKYKVLAFAVSAGIGSIAGSLYGGLLAYVTPEIFGTGLLINFLVIVFVGGAQHLLGSLIGSVFVVMLQHFLQDVGSLQTLTFGIALVLAMRFLPEGIASAPALLRQWRRPNKRRLRGDGDLREVISA